MKITFPGAGSIILNQKRKNHRSYSEILIEIENEKLIMQNGFFFDNHQDVMESQREYLQIV